MRSEDEIKEKIQELEQQILDWIQIKKEEPKQTDNCNKLINEIEDMLYALNWTIGEVEDI